MMLNTDRMFLATKAASDDRFSRELVDFSALVAVVLAVVGLVQASNEQFFAVCGYSLFGVVIADAVSIIVIVAVYRRSIIGPVFIAACMCVLNYYFLFETSLKPYCPKKLTETALMLALASGCYGIVYLGVVVAVPWWWQCRPV